MHTCLVALSRFSFLMLVLGMSAVAVFEQPVLAECEEDAYGYTQPNCVASVFKDVSHTPYTEAINYVRQEGIVSGYEDGSFRPRRRINRAEFAKILVEAVLGGASSGTSCFGDVPSDQWFAEYVCELQAKDIIGGYPDGTFRPTNEVNIAEAAKILSNLFNLSVRAAAAGEAWFIPYIEALANANAIPGTITDPTHLVTREEMAELILRLKESKTNKPSLTACDLVSSLCSGYRSLSDIGGHPHQQSIEFLVRRGFISGYDDGTFRPWAPVNRAEMLKLLLEAKKGKGVINTALQSCFSDVSTEWFAPFVCEAKNLNVVKGYQDGSFNPGQLVNRVEAMKMAFEIYEVNVPALGSGEAWYVPYITFAHKNNIFSRFSALPDRQMTRGDMAYLIHRLMAHQSGLLSFTGARDNRSAGCGNPTPGIAPTSSVINGITRNYITDVPDSYDPHTPIALTFGWHGRTNPNSQVRGYYKVYEASAGKTIMVYPAALSGGWKINRDVAVFDQLLAELSQSYCIDLDRVYIVGHSLGSWFTNSLACLRGDKIRASGSLGGSTTFNACSGPVAAITMHNPADRLSSFQDGLNALQLHREQNQCSETTVPYSSPDKANCVKYTECAPDAPVVWCPHTEDHSFGYYYPHGWPNWTGSEIWKFFESLN